MSDIDSDDDFIKCYECEIEVDVSEICVYKKSKVCKNCKEICEENDIAQPVIVMRKRAGNRAPSGFVKPTRISDELASFLGKDKGTEMARTEVTRDINKYIRTNGLQDKTNGRNINPDRKLFALLKIKSGEELTYFNIQNYMKKHFSDDDAIAQPVRMVYKIYEDMIYGCCNRESCVRIKCCGTVHGHVSLYGCDPEIVNYPLGLAGIFSKTNMPRCPGGVYLHGRSINTFMSDPFEETNLLRRLRLQKTERLNLIKEKEQNEKFKVKIQIEKDAKEIALRYKSLQEEKQKDRWESLTIGTKIVELESELCYKLHGILPYIYSPGGRLSLYEDNRFKTLDSVMLHSVILQAHEAYRTKNFEAKDHMEKILEILEKWLEEINPNKYREIKGLPRMFPYSSFNWKKDNLIDRFNMTSK